jgi:small subunit ribosomal protein S18
MNKETCFFTKNKIEHVDYKSVDLLKRFIGPHGNILSRKRTGLTAKYQRQVESAIKRARYMGLLPYIQE